MVGDRAAHRQASDGARQRPGQGPLGSRADDLLAEGAAAAASALYSPNEWPATRRAVCATSTPPSRSMTRSTASDIAINAGCAFSVSVSCSGGPSNISFESFCFSVSSTSSKTSRAARKAAARSWPIPTAWLPWPGKINACTGMEASVPIPLGAVQPEEPAPRSGLRRVTWAPGPVNGAAGPRSRPT